MTIYLDANASEPMRPQAVRAVFETLQETGNPASVHAAGRSARRLLETSRATIAQCLGGEASNLVFTSGGTEANNLAVSTLGASRQVICSAIEHAAVRAPCQDAIVVPVDGTGVLRLDVLANVLKRTGPSLVCLMLANNETGVVQPVAEAARLCRMAGAWLHVDAAQAVGRIPVDIKSLGATSIAFSGHKSGGPQGIGGLLVDEAVPVEPQIRGGGQELGRRGGTPNLAGIAGFAAALAAEDPDYGVRLTRLRDRIVAAATLLGSDVCGVEAKRLPNTICLALAGIRADLQLIMLDQMGFAVSAGAACSSGKIAASHVLMAMGFGERAGEAIRVSLPWNVASADVDAFIIAYRHMVERARS